MKPFMDFGLQKEKEETKVKPMLDFGPGLQKEQEETKMKPFMDFGSEDLNQMSMEDLKEPFNNLN